MYDGIAPGAVLQNLRIINDRKWPYKTNCPRGSAPTKISEVRIWPYMKHCPIKDLWSKNITQ